MLLHTYYSVIKNYIIFVRILDWKMSEISLICSSASPIPSSDDHLGSWIPGIVAKLRFILYKYYKPSKYSETLL